MSLFSKRKVFLDSAAGEGNPSAIYESGVKARKKLEEARTHIARTLSVQARDIILTSGGTESDNLAVLGVFEAMKEKVPRSHIIVGSLEHPAIMESAKEAERRGAELTVVEANEKGVIDPESIRLVLTENTVLISVSLISGEVGVVQNIGKIGRIVREFRKKQGTAYPYLHTDASQAERVVMLNPEGQGVDLMTLDSSKVGGPRGMGALVVRPGVLIKPIIFGGGQERGLRSGTENVEAAVSFAEAFVLAQKGSEKEAKRLAELREAFVAGLGQIPGVVVNGSAEHAAPNIVSISAPGKLHEFLAIQLAEKQVFVSTGVSCDANKNSEERQALRFSFGPKTTAQDLEIALRTLHDLLERF